MSKRTIEIEIDCQNKHCLPENGKFCPMLRTSRFGTNWHCQIFCEGEETLEEDEKGCLLRHPLCLACEKK